MQAIPEETPAVATRVWLPRWRRITLARSSGPLRLGLLALLALLFLATFADVISPYDPLGMNVAGALQPPSAQHWFGTDRFGRDMLSRVVVGTRLSLWISFASMGAALVAGVGLGIVAGFYEGVVDTLLSRVMDIFFSFPALLLAIGVAATLGPSTQNAVLAIAIVYAPRFYRVARAPVLAEKRLDYIEAARAMGARDSSLIFRHLLPNVSSPIIVQLAVGLSQAILLEAALGYLGLGVQPPTPSWGTMLNEGRAFLQNAPWTSIFPGLAIVLAVLGFNLMGDGLRDALDPRSRTRV